MYDFLPVLIFRFFSFFVSSIENDQISSISSIDVTLTATATLDQSGPGSNNNEGDSAFPNVTGMEPHHKMQFSVISGTLVGSRMGVFISLWRCSWCILQPHPTGLFAVVCRVNKSIGVYRECTQ